MPGISMELTWWLEGERPGLGVRQGRRADLCRAQIAAWGGTSTALGRVVASGV